MSRHLTVAALLAYFASTEAAVFGVTSGVAQVGNVNVTVTTQGGYVVSDGATVYTGFDCDNRGDLAGAITDGAIEKIAGRAVVIGNDCGYLVPDGDGVDFFGGPVSTFGDFVESDAGEVVVYGPTGLMEGDQGAFGLASVSAIGNGGVNVQKVAVPLPALDSGFYQARIVGDCANSNDLGGTYGKAEEESETPGYLVSGTDFDNPGTASIPVAGVTDLASLDGNKLLIGTLTGTDTDIFTPKYCGRIVVATDVKGYVASRVVEAANGDTVEVQGYVEGLPASMTGTFHVHQVKNDADNNGRKYPVCNLAETVGEHLLDSQQNDYFAQSDQTMTYDSSADGVATIKDEIKSAGGKYENLQYNAVIFHSTAAGNDLEYELRLGCANLNEPPTFGGTAPNNPPTTGSGASTVTVSGVAAIVAVFAAYFA